MTEAFEFPEDSTLGVDNLDFDQFWAEHILPKQEKVRILGEWIPVPNDVPLVLEQRAQRLDIGDGQATKDLLEALYGEGIYNRWIARGITLRQLTVIMAWSLTRIQGQKLSFVEVMHRIDELMASGKVKISFDVSGPPLNPDSSQPINSNGKT